MSRQVAPAARVATGSAEITTRAWAWGKSSVKVKSICGDIPDGGVVSCVVRAFYGLNFPQPEGGIVTVVYPIMLSPG